MPTSTLPTNRYTLEDARDVVDHLREASSFDERVEILSAHLPHWSSFSLRRMVPHLMRLRPEEMLKVLTYSDRTGEVACGFLPKWAA